MKGCTGTISLILCYSKTGEVHKVVSDSMEEYWYTGYAAKKAAKLAIKDCLSDVRVLLEDEDDDDDSDSIDDDYMVKKMVID